MLTFAFLNLLQNPEAYFKAQQEVDEILGRGACQVEHLSKLKYIDAVLRVILRLTPTAPTLSKVLAPGCTGDRATLGGKYAIDARTQVLILIGAMQRDPNLYGEDANLFKPERMLLENFKKLPSAAWKVWQSPSTIFDFANNLSAVWKRSQSMHWTCFRMAGVAYDNGNAATEL